MIKSHCNLNPFILLVDFPSYALLSPPIKANCHRTKSPFRLTPSEALLSPTNRANFHSTKSTVCLTPSQTPFNRPT